MAHCGAISRPITRKQVMTQMTTVEAIKAAFSPIENKEILELRKALSKEDWDKFGQDCAKFMGAEWKAST